jgi:hypothetical protein
MTKQRRHQWALGVLPTGLISRDVLRAIIDLGDDNSPDFQYVPSRIAELANVSLKQTKKSLCYLERLGLIYRLKGKIWSVEILHRPVLSIT